MTSVFIRNCDTSSSHYDCQDVITNMSYGDERWDHVLAAGEGSVSDDLDAVDGAPRSHGSPVAPSSMRMRTRVQKALHAIAMAHGVRRATRCGIVTTRRCSHPCRYLRTRRIAAASSDCTKSTDIRFTLSPRPATLW